MKKNLFDLLDDDVDETEIVKPEKTKKIKKIVEPVVKPEKKVFTEEQIVDEIKKMNGDPSNWGDNIDAINHLNGKVRVMHCQNSNAKHYLNPKVAIICKTENEKNEKKIVRHVFDTVEELCAFFNTYDMTDAMNGAKEKANDIFNKLFNKINTLQKDAMDSYNKLFPSWTIMLLPLNYKDGGTFSEPFIMNDKKKLTNVINLNLKQSKEMAKKKICCFSSNFTGFIPSLIMLLVGNNLPSSFVAIKFCRNLIYQKSNSESSDKAYWYKGWRVGILTNTSLNSRDITSHRDSFSEKGSIMKMLKNIDHVDYTNVISNITF